MSNSIRITIIVFLSFLFIFSPFKTTYAYRSNQNKQNINFQRDRNAYTIQPDNRSTKVEVNWIELMLGFGLGLLSAIFFEKLKTPKLRISIGNKTDAHPLPFNPQIKYSFLHLNVTNENWLGITSTALSVRAKIIFKDFESSKELFSIEGRWSGNPEPYIPKTPDGSLGIYNPPSLPLLRKMDLLPGETQELDLVIKYDDEKAIYAFSNENYKPSPIKMWHKNDWKIDLSEILVEVVVYSGEIMQMSNFILKNPGKDIRSVQLIQN